MKKGNGFEQCYNGQITVDKDEQLIVANDVTNNAADNESLIPMIKQTAENTGEKPQKVLADAGYKSEQNFQNLEKQGVKGYVSLNRGKKETKFNPDLKATLKMKRRLEGKRGKENYRKRKSIVEPPFGWIKQVLGFRGFSFRGLKKNKGEFNLLCLALNLRRLNNKIQWVSV